MAGRNRAHVISLRDPQPPILGRAPPPLEDPRLLHHPPPPLHAHPALILEERLAAQQREIHELLLDNQRLAATHVALKQELDAIQHELRGAASGAAKIGAERDAEIRDLYERSLRADADVRRSERMREELVRVRSDVRELLAVREDLAARLQGLKGELARARAEVQKVPVIEADIEAMQIELQKGRAAVEYEIKARAANLEQSQAMEKNMISMAREVEKLQAELADAEKRARAAAAAASVANPGPGYTGAYANSEMAYGGTSYANLYNMQQVQSGGNPGTQYGSAGSIPHGSYDMQHSHLSRFGGGIDHWEDASIGINIVETYICYKRML